MQPRPGTLLGATNPLILSGARHYPHIIRISPPISSYLSSSSHYNQNHNNIPSLPSSKDSSSIQGVFGSVSKATSSSYSSSKEASATAHGISSQRKRHVKKDTVALKAAEEKLKAFDCKGSHYFISILAGGLLLSVYFVFILQSPLLMLSCSNA
jgi:hypothetical protein